MNAIEERGQKVLREVVDLIPREYVSSFEMLRLFRLEQILEPDQIEPLRQAGLIDDDSLLTEQGAALTYEMIRRASE